MALFNSVRERRPYKKWLMIGLRVGLVVLVLGFPIWGVSQLLRKGKPSTSSNNVMPTQPEVAGALATTSVGQEIRIPLEADKTGKELIFRVDSAEKRNQILVKGKVQTAIAGRLFLVLNLKLTNNLDQGIEINTRDYVRLQVVGSSELLAPDIYNDPVEVQAISTKFTRLGFPIYETEKQFVLKIGEIKGEKLEIPLEI